MEIPMLLPRPRDNSAHLVLLGKYKVTRGKKKNKLKRLHITDRDALAGSLPNVRIHNSMTSNKSFQENILAETKSLAFIFIKDWERGGWGKEFYTPTFPKSFWELFSKLTRQKQRKMQQALNVCIIFQCLSTFSNRKYCSPSHRRHVTNVIIMPTPNSNKIHMKSRICLHSQFQDRCPSLVKLLYQKHSKLPIFYLESISVSCTKPAYANSNAPLCLDCSRWCLK